LMLPHRSVFAGLLLVAILFPPCWYEVGSRTGGGEPTYSSRRKLKAVAVVGVPKRNKRREWQSDWRERCAS